MSRLVKWKLREKYSRLFKRTALQFTLQLFRAERPQQEENLKEQTKNESKKRLLKD